MVSEWINTTFPVAPGAGSHTFHNLARSATASPFFARCGPVPETLYLYPGLLLCVRRMLFASGMCFPMYIPAYLQRDWALDLTALPRAVRSCLHDFIPDENVDLVGRPVSMFRSELVVRVCAS